MQIMSFLLFHLKFTHLRRSIACELQHFRHCLDTLLRHRIHTCLKYSGACYCSNKTPTHLSQLNYGHLSVPFSILDIISESSHRSMAVIDNSVVGLMRLSSLRLYRFSASRDNSVTGFTIACLRFFCWLSDGGPNSGRTT